VGDAVVAGCWLRWVVGCARRVMIIPGDYRTDLGPGDDARLVPLVSDNWTRVFSWTGEGEMPASERTRLHQIVTTAHTADQRVRFWATPDMPGAARDAVWNELLAAGVDHINTDDLTGLETFLRQQ
jgi:Glycerophosphoryl diester phosphodiesterase family